MIFNLVKKDFILAKKYLIFMLLFAAGAPLYLETQTHSVSGGLLGFFITLLFVQYMMFNTVSMAEDKFRGSALLSATPYTRSTLVKARYLYILVVFVGCYMIYTITASLFQTILPMLSISAIGISFLILALYFGIIMPLQYRFGYEKVRYISFFAIFITPFIFPSIIKWFQSNHMNLQTAVSMLQPIQDLLPWVLALIIGFVSMWISIEIYAKKDL